MPGAGAPQAQTLNQLAERTETTRRPCHSSNCQAKTDLVSAPGADAPIRLRAGRQSLRRPSPLHPIAGVPSLRAARLRHGLPRLVRERCHTGRHQRHGPEATGADRQDRAPHPCTRTRHRDPSPTPTRTPSLKSLFWNRCICSSRASWRCPATTPEPGGNRPAAGTLYRSPRSSV